MEVTITEPGARQTRADFFWYVAETSYPRLYKLLDAALVLIHSGCTRQPDELAALMSVTCTHVKEWQQRETEILFPMITLLETAGLKATSCKPFKEAKQIFAGILLDIVQVRQTGYALGRMHPHLAGILDELEKAVKTDQQIKEQFYNGYKSCSKGCQSL